MMIFFPEIKDFRGRESNLTIDLKDTGSKPGVVNYNFIQSASRSRDKDSLSIVLVRDYHSK